MVLEAIMLPVQKVIGIYQSSMDRQDRHPSKTIRPSDLDGHFLKKANERTASQQSFQDILKKKLQK